MSDTSIEWTDKTWNPAIRGCAKVSEGCRNCYAMKFAHRFSGAGGRYEGLTVLRKHGPEWTGEVRVGDWNLDAPLRWKKPTKVFVNSMSDLFHVDVPFETIAAVFGVMAACPQHTFQVLTKRPERAVEFFEWVESAPPSRHILGAARGVRWYAWVAAGRTHQGWEGKVSPSSSGDAPDWHWPLPNVHLGVSCENQEAADQRIPLLRQCPAAVRFVSAEPLLGSLDLSRHMWPVHARWPSGFRTPEEASAAGAEVTYHRQALVSAYAAFVGWVIVGGESGSGARPCDLAWIRSIVQQCKAAGTACFVKQLGAKPYDSSKVLTVVMSPPVARYLDGNTLKLRDSKGGDTAEFPEDLRVREFPPVSP